MSAGSFLIALAALSIGTYLMRFAGVKLGAAIATKGRRSRAGQVGSVASANPAASASPSTSANPNDQSASADSTERVTMWMDRATVEIGRASCRKGGSYQSGYGECGVRSG